MSSALISPPTEDFLCASCMEKLDSGALKCWICHKFVHVSRKAVECIVASDAAKPKLERKDMKKRIRASMNCSKEKKYSLFPKQMKVMK